MTRILLVGGTSAGHLAPMVAVAEALEHIEPGVTLSFACSDKPSDAAFLKLEGRTAHALPLPRRNAAFPLTFLRAFARSFAILGSERPDVVFSKGSAVSVPLCYAARVRGIPVVLHESDAVMGRANRIISSIAKKTLLAKDVGNPVRTRITSGKKEEGLRIAGFDGKKPVLLVMGGSQGAKAINEAIAANLDRILETCDVIHLTGTGKTVAKNKPGYHATEFGSDVLPHFYAATDLAVSRAGAGSIAELAACGIPAILVPIKGLAGDHQVMNAEDAEKTGAAIALPQEKIGDLPSTIASLLQDSVRMQTMRDRCRYAARPEASRLIAETVLRSVAR
jgi:UDP-N-acetylglucosamine--N-acetylmuramyl-(pentapeptide) pyrophosphoryl-undecaprenol N-acetylglucosamine transferase